MRMWMIAIVGMGCGEYEIKPSEDTSDTSPATDTDTEEDCEQQVFYSDADGDGYGNPDDPVEDCEQPEGTTTDATDCDDGDPSIHPGAEEECDAVDHDCDGDVGVGEVCLSACDVEEDVSTGVSYAFCYGEGTEGNYAAAQTTCDDAGATLVVIEDASENEFIRDIADTLKTSIHNSDAATYGEWWIGLCEDAHSGWLWADGSALAYTPVSTDLNDNGDGVCAVIRSPSGDGGWYDTGVTHTRPFVCQLP